MGAALSEGHIESGRVICPWHGRAFGPEPCAGYKPLVTHDDGLLAWVQLDDGNEPLTERPYLTQRPASGLDAVIRLEAECEPSDVIANRLDPWHGTHYHPHSFGRLRVLERTDTDVTVRVAYRVLGPFSVEVDARFHCPDARTIVMTIVEGDGQGSVVETHATPLRAGKTAVTELTVATSDRLGFPVVQRLAGALRPVMQWAARRLWVEDAAYAERTYALRHGALSEQPPTAQGTRAVRSQRDRAS
jgi:isorenieratene synthase